MWIRIEAAVSTIVGIIVLLLTAYSLILQPNKSLLAYISPTTTIVDRQLSEFICKNRSTIKCPDNIPSQLLLHRVALVNTGNQIVSNIRIQNIGYIDVIATRGNIKNIDIKYDSEYVYISEILPNELITVHLLTPIYTTVERTRESSGPEIFADTDNVKKIYYRSIKDNSSPGYLISKLSIWMQLMIISIFMAITIIIYEFFKRIWKRDFRN